MQTADSPDLFSDYQESLPAVDSDDHDAPASPGLLRVQKLQQTSTIPHECAANKQQPHFEFPVIGEYDPDSAFPFQLGTNVSLAKASRRQASSVEEAGEGRIVSVITDQLTPDQELQVEGPSVDGVTVSPKEPPVHGNRPDQLTLQGSPSQAPALSPEGRDSASVCATEDLGEKQTAYSRENDDTPVASVVTPNRPVIQSGEHERTSSHGNRTSPQYDPNEINLPTSANTVRPRQDRFPNSLMESEGTIRGSSPTEEELLMLLNRRNKSRMHENARLVSFSRSLQSQNLALLKDRKAAIEQIEKMSSDLEEARQHNTALESQMESFQNKYVKLKAWAIEMNQEYALLDAARGRINTSLAEAKQDHVKLTQDAREARAIHERAAGSLVQLKQELRDTKEEVSRNGIDTAVLQTKLDDASKSLQQEQARNKKYVEHISLLTHTQDKTAKLMDHTTNTVTSAFEKASESFRHGLVDVSGKKLDECLTTLRGVQQTLQAHIATTPEHERCTDLADAQMGIVQSMMDHLNPLLSGFNSLNTGHMQDILRAVHDVGPELEREKSLIKANATLEERQRTMGKLETMLRGDKTAALLHLTGLLEVHKQLLVKSTPAAENPQALVDLRTRFDQIQLLHAQKTYELTRVQQQLSFQKQHAARMNADATTATANLQKGLSDAQNSFHQQLDQEIKSKQQALSTLSNEHRAALSTRDQELQDTRLELDREHGRNEDLIERIKRLSCEIKENKQLSSRQQDDISAAKRELAKLTADKSHVDQELALAKTQADRVPSLECQIRELRDANADSNRHKQRAEMLEEKQLSLEAELSKKSAELYAAELQAVVLDGEVKSLQNGKQTYQEITLQVKELLSGLNSIRNEASQAFDSFKTAATHQEEATQQKDDSPRSQVAARQMLDSQYQIENLQTVRSALQAVPGGIQSRGESPQPHIDTSATLQRSIVTQARETLDDGNVDAYCSNTIDRLPGSAFDDDEDMIVDFSQDVMLSQPNAKDRRYEISSSIFCTPDFALQQVANESNAVAHTERSTNAFTAEHVSCDGARTATISLTRQSMMPILEEQPGVLAQCGRSDSPLSEHDSWFDEIDPDNHNGHGIDEADFDEDDFDADEINAAATVNPDPATALAGVNRTSSLSDDMLLRSSLPPGSPTPATKAGRPQLQVRVQTPQKSPVKLRSGHQVQLASRGPAREIGRRESTPRLTEREPVRPNSAAKRSSTEIAESGSKRSKHSVEKVDVGKPASQAGPGMKGVGDWTDLSRQLPVGSRSSGSVFKPQAAAATAARAKPSKFKMARKTAKDNKYSQRFSSQA